MQISEPTAAPVTKVEIGKIPDQGILSEWYEKHGIKVADDGTFTELPYGEAPVSEDGIIEQVRINAQRHNIRNLRGERFRQETMVFIAGGPSLNQFVDEIRAKCVDPAYDVYTSNKTCSWMLSKGMKPKYHVIIDPTERKKLDLEYDDKTITVVLGLQCHPAVFDKAIENGQTVLKFLAASATRANGETDAQVALAACTQDDPEIIGIGGGSMAGTRMLYLAAAMGYRRIEYYGFDACCVYENNIVKNYAYSKVRNEHVIEVTAGNGRTFYSTVSLARQAEEIVRLMDNLPGLEVVVHGDTFMANQVAMYKETKKPADYLISPAYAKMMSKMHDTYERYGTSGDSHASRVFMAGAQIVKKFGKCDILDYGCGKETLRIAMEEAFPTIPNMRVIGYDPGMPATHKNLKKSEIVVCTDVMEHVEPECIDNVLSHICSLTEHVAIINVSLIPAVKVLPDGRNSHISLHSKDWWNSYFKKYFVIIEQADSPAEFLVVGQPIRRWIQRMEEKKAA